MKRLFFVFSFILVVTGISAQQDTTIKGTGILLITSDPNYCSVTIMSKDNKKYLITKKTPMLIKNIKFGVYLITISKEGYEPRTIPVSISKNDTIKYNVKLELKSERVRKQGSPNRATPPVPKPTGLLLMSCYPNNCTVTIRPIITKNGRTIYFYSDLESKVVISLSESKYKKKLEIGEYELLFEKDGYKAHAQKINVLPDKQVECTVTLKKE